MVVLANHLLKEPLVHVLWLFQHEELGIEDWAKERIAKAIWLNLEWQDKLPNEVAASPRMQQIWNQECAQHFPEAARDKVSRAVKPVDQDEPPSFLSDDGIQEL